MLLELCLSMLLSMLIGTLIIGNLAFFVKHVDRLQGQLKLVQAERYILTILQHDLGYNTSAITIDINDGQHMKLICANIAKDRTLTFSNEKVNGIYGLYKITKTVQSSGKNPAFLPDCVLQSFTAQAISTKDLDIKGTLKYKNYYRSFKYTLHCLNGTIHEN